MRHCEPAPIRRSPSRLRLRTTLTLAAWGTLLGCPEDSPLGEGPDESPRTGIEGVLYDTNGSTPLAGLHYSLGPVTGSTGTGANGTTDAQGRWGAEVGPGRYAVFAVGIDGGSRYVTTPGDTADVVEGKVTHVDLNIRRGYYLEIMNTGQNVAGSAGSSLSLTLNVRAWNRDLCPGCVPAIVVGVAETPLAVYRFKTLTPGVYPGVTETASIPITVPASGGTLYAMLFSGSTGAGPQPGLDGYADVWSRNVSTTTLIPFGQLQVN